MKRLLTYRTAFMAFLAVYAALFFISGDPAICQASAHTNPIGYCFVTDVTVTNTSAADLTDHPVRVLFPAKSLIAGGQLDPRGWDAFPVIGSLNNEIDILQQSLTSTQAPYWFTIPDLPAGQSRTVQLFSGENERRQDQGVRFTGVEYIQAPDHADFDITDNLDITIGITNFSDSARNQIWLEHHDNAGGGYRIQFENFAGALNITFVVDAINCRLAWNPAWNDSPQLFRFEYIAAAGLDAFIYRDGSLAQSCDTDSGPLTVTTNNLIIGATAISFAAPLTAAVVSHVEIAAAGVLAARYGFDPRRTIETSSTLPYSGTTEDYSGNGHTATYTFNRSQADVAFHVGSTTDAAFVSDITLGSDPNSVVGAPVPGGFETARPAVVTGFMYDLIIVPLTSIATATNTPTDGVIAGLFYTLGLVLAVIVWKTTGGYMPAAVLALGVGPTLAVVLGHVSEWWLILWGLTVAVVWFAQLRSQQES